MQNDNGNGNGDKRGKRNREGAGKHDASPAASGGLGNEADPASDPRHERYLEYCADMQQQGLPCADFEAWLIQSEESY